MPQERVFWLLMRIEMPDTLGWEGEHPDSPIGFMPVFESEAAALHHADGVYAVHPIRLIPPQKEEKR
jgi:hypothetical protein